MQRLTYINLRGESVVFGYGAPWLLRSVKGLGMCENNLTLSSGSGQNGSTLQSMRREEREITAVIQLLGADRTDMYRQRETLCRRLSPDLAADGEKRARLLYENDAGAWWTWAIPCGDLDWGSRFMDIHTGLNVRFTCESPFLYGKEPNEVVFKQTRGGFKLPFSFPLQLGAQSFDMVVTNAGSAESPVTVTIDGCGETPALENLTTGTSLSLITSLPQGDRLTIQTDPSDLSVWITRADGTEENAFGFLDPLSSVSAFVLRPGENRLAYVPDGDKSRSVIRVKWYDAYEGV